MTQPTACQSTEGGWLVIQIALNLTRLVSPCYNNNIILLQGVLIFTNSATEHKLSNVMILRLFCFSVSDIFYERRIFCLRCRWRRQWRGNGSVTRYDASVDVTAAPLPRFCASPQSRRPSIRQAYHSIDFFKYRTSWKCLCGRPIKPHYGSCLFVRPSFSASVHPSVCPVRAPNSRTKKRRKTKIGTDVYPGTGATGLPTFTWKC